MEKINDRDSALKWLNDIDTFDSNGGLTSRASLRMRKNPQLLKDFQIIVGLKSDNPSELIYSLLNPSVKGVCENCGKPTDFVSFKIGYRKACCKKCADILTLSKGKSTKLEKYGDENYNNPDKVKETKKERYGTPGFVNPEKSKQTKLLRYGHMNYNNDSKRRETCLEKYGVDNASKLDSVKEKMKNTFIERYGCNSPMESELFKEKYKENFRQNHGCEWPQENPEIHKKTLGHYEMTSPESKMYYFLLNRGFDFEHSYQLNGKNFDFAIFKNGELSILVEIDGRYFHGLLSDYDGVNVKGETDFLRFSKCPEGVKLIVCDDNNVEKCFEEVLEVFDMSYEEWISKILSMLSKDFPYPNYSEQRMKKDYEHLCSYDYKKGQYLALSVVNNFHRSIWDAHHKGKPSPFEAWNDKELLEKCVRNRFIYASNLSTQNILNGFTVCKIAPRISVFSPSLARHLVNKYLSEYDEIFDPFSGFSGRMLGACSLGKKYIGQDINKDHIRESDEIKDFLDLDASLRCKNVLKSKGKYECLFTCPPYGGKEHWNNLNDLVEKSCDEWIDECLSRFDCKKYLFVVDKTEKYKDKIVKTLTNKSHFGSNHEYVVLI